MLDSPDLFKPHMPKVEVPADVDALFADARADALGGNPRQIVIVTPGRMRLCFPAATPGSIPKDAEDNTRSILGGDRPLAVSVVAYTKPAALMNEYENNVESLNRCIPFFGHLLGFVYVGHSVVVFEGHPSAFRAGVRDVDVLLIDSAMLPFLQKDWTAVAFGAMRPGGRIFVHHRKDYSLTQVRKAKNAKGWDYVEPDGEASYLNCLLTAMAKAPKQPVRIVAGRPLPDITRLTTDPDELEWISALPFKYKELNAEKVMAFLFRLAKREGLIWRSLVLKVRVALDGGVDKHVSFTLDPGQSADRRQQVVLERQ